MEITKFLVENGADVNADDGYALMAAVHSNDLDLVKYLVENGAHIDEHLLTIASENWYTEIYNYLQNKFNTNESIKHLLKPKSEEDIKNSIMNSNSSDRLDKIFRFKLNHLFSDDEILEICKDLTPDEKLYKGTRHNIPILIKQSILDGVNTGKNNQMLIKFASQNGYSDIIEMLLKDDRVNPIVHNNLPIAYAAENGHLDAVKVLMNDKRVDPSDYNNAAIKYALKNKHLSVVKQLMNDKRVVDKLEPIDKQNIRIELEYGYKSLFKDIERKMKSNESIKHFLKPKSKEDILKSIEKLSPHEKLQHACEYGILWLFKQSLDEGANPAYQDNYPIRYASAGGYYTIVKILLSLNGVNPSDLNNSAIVMAYYYKHKDIVELLLNDKRVKNSLSKYDLKRYKKYIKFDIRESLINEFIDYEVKYWALYYHIYDNFFSKLDNREEIQELRNKLIDEFGKELAPVINFFADYRLKKLDI